MSETKASEKADADKVEAMSDEDFSGLMAGMQDVLRFYRDERDGFVIHTAQDIKAIRQKAKLSQPKFAEAYQLEVATLRDWEQGRRQPDRPAQVLLKLIDEDPEMIRRMLGG